MRDRTFSLVECITGIIMAAVLVRLFRDASLFPGNWLAVGTLAFCGVLIAVFPKRVVAVFQQILLVTLLGAAASICWHSIGHDSSLFVSSAILLFVLPVIVFVRSAIIDNGDFEDLSILKSGLSLLALLILVPSVYVLLWTSVQNDEMPVILAALAGIAFLIFFDRIMWGEIQQYFHELCYEVSRKSPAL